MRNLELLMIAKLKLHFDVDSGAVALVSRLCASVTGHFYAPVWLHSMLSFLFYTVILALTINVVASSL